MRLRLSMLILVVVAMGLNPTPAASQTAPARTMIEVVGGYTGFFDDGGAIDHAVAGGGARFFVTRRLAVGPEVLYMRGPGQDKDVVITGSLSFDLRTDTPERRAIPYVIVNGGQLRHWGEYLPPGMSSGTGPYISFGGGVRIRISDRIFVAPEYRIGFEPHSRFTVSVGVR